MHLDPALLATLVAVVDSGGFSAAGERLGLTQSAVSAQIKRLEEQAGAALLERTSRQLRLTEAGGTLLPYARRIGRLQQAAEAALGRGRQAPAIRLGISEEQGSAYLPRVLPDFARRFPEARLSLVCASSTELVTAFGQGELDLALTIRHQGTEPGDLVGREPLVWVARGDVVFDPKGPLPLACFPEGCVFRALSLEALARSNRAWRIACVSQSPVGINAAVAAGLAVAVKTPRAVPAGARVLGEADGLPRLPPAIVELHRSTATLTPAGEAFAELLLAAVRKEIAAA